MRSAKKRMASTSWASLDGEDVVRRSARMIGKVVLRRDAWSARRRRWSCGAAMRTMRAAAERLLAVVAGLGLDAVDPAAGAQRARRERRAGEQAAAAEADEQRVERADLLDQLLRRRALAGDHVRVVVGRDQRHAALLGEPAADRLAVFGVAVVEDDLAAVALGGGQLRGRRVAAASRSTAGMPSSCAAQRDRLRVVARREGDHAGAALAVVEAARARCRRRGT